MGTTPVHTFLWSEAGPLNYDRTIEKWPRTQTLEPVYEVNSSAFLAPLSTYSECHDRIGSRPWLHPINRLVAFDIDWIEDFIIAEQLLLKGLVAV
jgi:CMP-N-acetylneuraminic acid synthetase